MCFSPEADLTTGVVVAVVGIDALRHVSRPSQIGLANLAVVGVINWLTFTGLTSLWCAWAAIGSVAIAVYLPRVAGQDMRLDVASRAAA